MAERPPTVLVVDDDARVTSLVQHLLADANMSAITIANAEDAWTELVRERPDAAVIDLRLPGEDGWSLIEHIRADGRFASLPVVVLTGVLEPDVMERASALGCEYLGKPFAGQALVDRVRRVLDATPSTATGADPKVEMEAVPVVIVLSDLRVAGRVHFPPEISRFSDAWESVVRDARDYVPVTDATISSHDGTVLASERFMQVAKTHIRAVFPAE